ncbi:uncharacterized protein LOC122369142 [Amphibalanus amphitrite]|uniref:uncharacterized protein LOC122369142 n=1 Tax=Amphibalanus amphitrite TaxID=1232801 RepID=UPI001C911DAE|nr:uncharacterized protein LOC122369142 [Amphibalanus amphitrite]
MWYEILPSFGIIVGALSVPCYAMYFCNQLVYKNPNVKSLKYLENRQVLRRDQRLFGDYYKWKGLENIPDK